jgi:hypothetical protein
MLCRGRCLSAGQPDPLDSPIRWTASAVSPSFPLFFLPNPFWNFFVAVFTVSLHCEAQAFPSITHMSDLDVPLPAGTTDAQYMKVTSVLCLLYHLALCTLLELRVLPASLNLFFISSMDKAHCGAVF